MIYKKRKFQFFVITQYSFRSVPMQVHGLGQVRSRATLELSRAKRPSKQAELWHRIVVHGGSFQRSLPQGQFGPRTFQMQTLQLQGIHHRC